MIGKLAEIRKRIKHFDIVAITETWAHDQISDTELEVDGFSIFRADRKDRAGGGVLLYVKSTLTAQAFDKFSDICFEENIWCTLNLEKTKLLIGVCYRSPTSSDVNNNRLLSVLDRAVREVDCAGTKKMHLLLMGDFNFQKSL